MIDHELSNKDILWIMSRYNHENPKMLMSTTHIAGLIGLPVLETRKMLSALVKDGSLVCERQHCTVWRIK
jgi:hypothetical protein